MALPIGTKPLNVIGYQTSCLKAFIYKMQLLPLAWHLAYIYYALSDMSSHLLCSVWHKLTFTMWCVSRAHIYKSCLTWAHIYPGGAVKYEVDTGVRPALQQAGAFGESTGSKNEGSLGESMIFGIQWEKNTKICGVIRWDPKVFSILDCKITKVKYIVFFWNASFSNHWALSDRLNEKIWVFGWELMQL